MDATTRAQRRLLKPNGIKPSVYINLEYDLGFKKEGPFTTFNYEEDSEEKIVLNLNAFLPALPKKQLLKNPALIL